MARPYHNLGVNDDPNIEGRDEVPIVQLPGVVEMLINFRIALSLITL